MNTRTMLRLAGRNASRRPARTAFTAGMVVVSVALLVIALTLLRGVVGQILADGVSAVGEVRVVTAAYAQREELLPLYENLAELPPLVDALKTVPGVRAVEPRISTGVTVTIGQEIGDVFALVVGANESYFRERLKGRDKLIAGAWFTGAEGELVVGRWVAQQLGAKPGDELVLLGATQDGSMSPIKGRLVGVVHGAGVDQQVLAPLERLQFLADLPGGATEVLLYGDDMTSAPQLASAARALPAAAGLMVQPWTERDPWQSTTAVVNAVEGIIVFILALLTALGIWNTMTMTVLERTSELGVLRAMGMSRSRVVALVVSEAVAIGIGGGLVGVALSLGPSWWLSSRGLHLGERAAGGIAYPIAETVYGHLDAGVFLAAFFLGVVMAFIGSIVPALRAASIQPVNAMRSGR